MARRNQGGWIATFLVVGAVLLLGLLGGVYYLKTMSNNAQKNPVATDNSTGESTETTLPEEAPKEDTQAAPSGTSSPSTDSQPTPATQEQSAAVTPAPQSAAVSEMPVTGPTETFYSVIVLSLVTFSFAIYMASLRTVRTEL